MITGAEKPDAGSFRTGETVKLAYVEQNRDVLDPNHTIWQAISDGKDTVKLGPREVNSRAYVARFTSARISRRKSGRSRAASAIASTLRAC